MNIAEQTLEGQLAQEARQREIDELFATGDWEGLQRAASVLNAAFSQQLVITRWFAAEAAENLGEAWQQSRKWTDC